MSPIDRAVRRPFLLASFVFALAAPLLGARAAQAQTSCGDSSCPKGYSCETEPVPCAAIDCVGTDCKTCEATTQSVCRPLPCSADTECDVGMVCAEVTSQSCTDAAAPDCSGGDCAKAAETGCVNEVTHQCLPRWVLPCQTAADCGEGFSCDAVEQCSCSGSSGSSGSGSSGSAGTGGAASSAAPECVCEPTDEKSCRVIRTACVTDADCSGGFSCQDNPEGVCSSTPDGGSQCEPADPPKLCMPPYADLEASAGGTSTAGKDDGLGTSPETTAQKTQASGGCSVAHVGAAGSAAPFLLALGAALGLARRRRRDSTQARLGGS